MLCLMPLRHCTTIQAASRSGACSWHGILLLAMALEPQNKLMAAGAPQAAPQGDLPIQQKMRVQLDQTGHYWHLEGRPASCPCCSCWVSSCKWQPRNYWSAYNLGNVPSRLLRDEAPSLKEDTSQ